MKNNELGRIQYIAKILFDYITNKMTTINKSLITAYSMTVIYSNSMLEWIRNSKNLYEKMNDEEKALSSKIIARAEEERKWKDSYKRFDWIADRRIDEMIQWYIGIYESEHDTRRITVKAMFLWKNNDCYDYDFFTYDEEWEFIAYRWRENLSKRDSENIEMYCKELEYNLNQRNTEEAK